MTLVRMGPDDMPAYSKRVLSDEQLADIVAYLSTLSGPVDSEDFPLLSK